MTGLMETKLNKPLEFDSDSLSRMIARLKTQRVCLDLAASQLRPLPGCILEVGLGKGRTYDRLRTLFPDRKIVVLDKMVHCTDEVRPPAECLMIGDFRDSLRQLRESIGGSVALAHADIGSNDRNLDAGLASAIAPLLDSLVANGGWIITDREMRVDRWRGRPLPPTASGWPYYIYRAEA